MPKGQVSHMSNPRKARSMDVKDLGGDKPKKRSAKDIVAKSNVKQLIQEWKVQDQIEKDAKKRKDALRTTIMTLTEKTGQKDVIGNIYAKVGNWNVKHEVRRTIKPLPFEEVDTDWAEEQGIDLDELFPKQEVRVLDEAALERLIEEEVLTADEAEQYLLKITQSVALKIEEDKEDGDNN